MAIKQKTDWNSFKLLAEDLSATHNFFFKILPCLDLLPLSSLQGVFDAKKGQREKEQRVIIKAQQS